MDDLHLHRTRWWAKELRIGLKTILNAITLGELETVRLSDAPNAPHLLHAGHIRNWYSRRTQGGQ